jgi:hypothetical protein
MVPSINLPFPNRDVLVVAFLVPIVWIVEIKNKITLLFACLFILFASVPFVCAMFSPSPKIYFAGLLLALASIVLFSSLEIAGYYRSRVTLTKAGRSDI